MRHVLYGLVAVKFRAFGIDFGFIKKSIPAEDPVRIDLPVAIPVVVPIKFDKFGVKLDLTLKLA